MLRDLEYKKTNLKFSGYKIIANNSENKDGLGKGILCGVKNHLKIRKLNELYNYDCFINCLIITESQQNLILMGVYWPDGYAIRKINRSKILIANIIAAKNNYPNTKIIITGDFIIEFKENSKTWKKFRKIW